MKVLIVNCHDVKGGAARAAYRLYRGLIEVGADSEMLVQKKGSNDPGVTTPYKSKIGESFGNSRPYFNAAVQKLQHTSNASAHSSNILPSGLHRQINKSDAEVVHLHWINGEMISISEISKIQKPIVWTLHDMWAFCGAEHYDDLDSPGRYKEGYFKWNCPPNYKGFDINRWTWKRKMNHWENMNFNIVTPSNWLADCAKESRLFENKHVQTIPNGLDLDVYRPIPKEWARNILNIGQDDNCKYILFGALSATSDSRKGYQQLNEALSIIKDDNYRLIVFGSERPDNGFSFGLPTNYLGQLTDDEVLALSYSAADVMVVPSLQDNLPNTAVEAVACGTPVVAFNIGGVPDIIEHKKNGYLVKPYDTEDLARGIEWLLDNRERISELSKNSRKTAEEKYDITKIAERYISCYESVLSESKNVH